MLQCILSYPNTTSVIWTLFNYPNTDFHYPNRESNAFQPFHLSEHFTYLKSFLPKGVRITEDALYWIWILNLSEWVQVWPSTMSYFILIFRVIGFFKMTKSYHINKILEPSCNRIFPWVYQENAIYACH